MPLHLPQTVRDNALSQFSFKGKITAVTGGASGIGLQIVNGLAEAGADIALLYSTSTHAPQVASDAEERTGLRVQVYQTNVSSRGAIATTLSNVCSEFGNGRLDIVVANAGVCINCSSLEYTEETWRRDNDVNYNSVMWTAQAAGNIFKRQGHGNLVITASVGALVVNSPQALAAYNASKAATLQLARSLAVEWPESARVNYISSGYMMERLISQTPEELFQKWLSLSPMGRIADPAELKAEFTSSVCMPIE